MPELELGDWKSQNEMERWLTWQKVWGAMLFPTNMKPENPSLRKDHQIISLTLLTIRLNKKDPFDSDGFSFWMEKYFHRTGGLEDLLDATKFSDMDKKINQAFDAGQIAGEQFFNVAALSQEWPKNAKNKMSKGIAAFLMHKYTEGKEWAVSRTNAEKYWNNMRPAIHLWAALHVYIDLLDKKDSYDVDPLTFLPYGLDNLPAFLSLAEEFKKIGLKYYPRDKQKPLLDENLLYTLPQDFVLPKNKLTIKVESFNDELKMIKNEYKSTIDPEYLKKNS